MRYGVYNTYRYTPYIHSVSKNFENSELDRGWSFRKLDQNSSDTCFCVLLDHTAFRAYGN